MKASVLYNEEDNLDVDLEGFSNMIYDRNEDIDDGEDYDISFDTLEV
jgi:hypothetical protein